MNSTRRFLFIHVMKTGGTSLVFHLLREFAADETYPNAALDRRHPTDAEPYASIPDLVSVEPSRRKLIRLYSGHFPYMVRDLIDADVTVFTLLRDPVDRTVSVLKQFKRLYERYHDLPLEKIYEDPVVYRHFIENHQTKIFSATTEDHPNMLASRVGFQAFLDYLTSPASSAGQTNIAADDTITIDVDRLARAKSNLESVDVLGLNERYHDFVEALRDRFGWWKDGIDGGARANVSSEPWEANAALRDRIAVDNRFDLEFYEHARELVRRRQG